MKNKLFVLFLVLANSSVFSQIEVTFSGQIQNPNSDSLIVEKEVEWGHFIVMDVIRLDKDGKFHAVLEVPDKGVYGVNDGLERGSAYFTPNGKLFMTLNAKEFDETILFKGDGALESNYLAEKYLLIEKMGLLTYYGHYGKLEERDFLNLNDSILDLHLKLIEKYPKLDNELVFKEKSFYEFDHISRCHNYPTFYGYLTGNKLVLSDTFPDPYSGFDMNNEKYLEIFNFRSVLKDYLSQLYRAELKKGTYTKGMAYINLMHVADKSIESEKVKEEMVYYVARYNLKRSADIDSCFQLFKSLVKKEAYVAVIKEQYDKLKLLEIGAPSPKFAFKDRNDKLVHLDDLKGNLVYVDIWATWCGPCLKEIPALKKLQDTLVGQDIIFVSICKEDTKERWIQALEKYRLEGIQLFAEEGDDKFFDDYSNTGYPHFILIGKQGEIISPDARRPGDPKLMEMIQEHLN